MAEQLASDGGRFRPASAGNWYVQKTPSLTLRSVRPRHESGRLAQTVELTRASVPAARAHIRFLLATPTKFRSGKLAQIGRESCRERVCRYVLIAVFAGSFKKKIIHELVKDEK